MANRSILIGLLVLGLAAPALALGDRYLLPPAAELALEAVEDAKAPGTFTLTGRAKALVVGLGGATLGFRLPPSVEAIGELPAHRGTLAKDKEVVLTAKVKLKEGRTSASLAFQLSYDFDARFWLEYIEGNEKGYPLLPLRDLLYRETQSLAGKPGVLATNFVLERRKR